VTFSTPAEPIPPGVLPAPRCKSPSVFRSFGRRWVSCFASSIQVSCQNVHVCENLQVERRLSARSCATRGRTVAGMGLRARDLVKTFHRARVSCERTGRSPLSTDANKRRLSDVERRLATLSASGARCGGHLAARKAGGRGQPLPRRYDRPSCAARMSCRCVPPVSAAWMTTPVHPNLAFHTRPYGASARVNSSSATTPSRISFMANHSA
jgi:hypothetical protein